MAKSIQRVEKFLQSSIGEETATLSSKSNTNTLFDHDNNDSGCGWHETNNTSLGSALSEKIDLETFKSDVAEYGSDSIHSACSESTSSLDDPKKDLPKRSTEERIQEIGSHLPSGLNPLMEPMFRPRTYEQTRFMSDRVKQANGKHVAAVT